VLTERRAIDPDTKKMWRLAASASAVGLEIVVAIGLPSYVGYRLDGKFGTKWIMYVGLVIGIGAAIKALVRLTRAYKRLGENDDSGPRKD
jgi:F0F1-type ATP synthase assembly protein I